MAEIIRARSLQLRSTRGQVYGPLDLDLPSGVSILHGPVGAGRTSIVLTLSGRMAPGAGSELQVLGLQLPGQARAVQRLTAIAGFAGIDDLDDAVAIGACVGERMAWLAPWWKFVRHPDQAALDRVTDIAFAGEGPKVGDPVWSLSAADQLLLKISIALLSRPRALFIDSIEQVQSPASRLRVWRSLDAIADTGIDVVIAAASSDAGLWGSLDMRPTVVAIHRGTIAPEPAVIAAHEEEVH